MTHPLITRLSKLDAPDREVDNEIHLLFFADDIYGSHVPPFTASVDAVIALAERELPGWTWYLGFGLRLEGDMRAIAGFYPNNQPDSCVKDDHPIPATALCIALLRAKEASL